MGKSYLARCKKCDYKFRVRSGGGFVFHLLHCDRCGRERSISFDEIGEAHLKYLKGLEGPYAIATSAHDRYVRENYPGDPISEAEYRKVVEEIAGQCECGGRFRFDAPARCPRCKSDDIEAIGEVLMYD